MRYGRGKGFELRLPACYYERMAEPPRYRFPGMDPWLEHPSQWLTFHTRLVPALADDLAAKIAPRYVAMPGERVIVENAEERDIYPDITVHKRQRQPMPGLGGFQIDPAVTVAALEPEHGEGFVEVRLAGPRGRVVTVVEILSHSNKRPGADGYEKYRKKQREVLASDVNLVEIDLLRRGEHTVAIPVEKLECRRPYDYLVAVHRANRRGLIDAYFVRLRDRLPRIPIPLAPPDPDAGVDLQALVARVYGAGFYGLDIDYTEPSVPPLIADDAAWAAEIARSRG